MKRKRSLAFLGVLALALTVTVGLLGGVAEAQKKGKKKKGAKQVTVSKTAPTTVPAGNVATNQFGVATVPLNVGKKAKGKVVSSNSVTVTTSWSAPAGSLDEVFVARLKAPNGRTVALASPPFDDAATAAGPITETPNSAAFFCIPDPVAPPPPPCPDPDDTLGPPYAGTVGNLGLAFFGGVPARGTWTLQVINGDPANAVTLNSASVRIGLVPKPKSK
jgi:hypothetical protein